MTVFYGCSFSGNLCINHKDAYTCFFNTHSCKQIPTGILYFFHSLSRGQGLNVVLLPSFSNPMLAAPCYDVFLITCKKCFLNVLNSNDFMVDKVSVLNGVTYR